MEHLTIKAWRNLIKLTIFSYISWISSDHKITDWNTDGEIFISFIYNNISFKTYFGLFGRSLLVFLGPLFSLSNSGLNMLTSLVTFTFDLLEP